MPKGEMKCTVGRDEQIKGGVEAERVAVVNTSAGVGWSAELEVVKKA